MFVNGSGRNEQSLQRTFHRCFLPSFGSFGQAVSEEKIIFNQPIRNKNCLWRPCLLMDWDEMNNLYRGPSIDASYQVSVHLAEGIQRRRLKCERWANNITITQPQFGACLNPGISLSLCIHCVVNFKISHRKIPVFNWIYM